MDTIKFIRKLFLLVLTALAAAAVKAETVDVKDDTTVTLSDLETEIEGNNLTINSSSFSGSNQQAGIFSGYTFLLGSDFDSGVILGTGNVANVIAATNTNDGTSGSISAVSVNDTHMGNSVFDPAKIIFDITPNNNTLLLDFVFGSEEYNEYVHSAFNDNMRILVNGTNCALTPDGQVFSIDSVNDRANFPPASGTNGPSSNPSLFINNDPGSNAGESNTATYATEMDGFTTRVSCRATVNPGVSNTVVLGIADVGDEKLDSWVFFRASSLRSEGSHDFGDAPDDGAANNYETLNANSGANHLIKEGLFLGGLPSGDTDGFVDGTDDNNDASDDSNDDGVSSFPTLLDTHTSYNLDVTATSINGKGATIIGWIDFDGSGTFDADEASSTASLSSGDADVTRTLSWSNLNSSGPDMVAGLTYARVRIVNSDEAIGASDSGGTFNSGEVEDYRLEITDNVPPTVQIQGVPPNTNAAFTATFEFSEDVIGFTIGDISVGNGAASNFTTTDGNTYTALITPSADGNVTLDVNASVATDAAGNNNTAATQAIANFDGIAPSIDIQNVPTVTNSPFTATFEFSEDVNDFVLGDISVGNGTASSFNAVDGNTYTALITPTAVGNVTLDVNAAVATDDTGNDNTAAAQAVAAYETTSPTVAIQNVPADTNSPFTATFEFSEDVNDFVLGDISVGNGTASSFNAVDGNTYTALITPTAEGDVTLDVNAAVATDAAGNDNTAATQAVAAYETTSPTVAIQNVPADTNSPFTATFEFSEDVNGFVLGDISVGNGTASGFTAVDGNTYTALITPTAEGDVTLDVNAAVATDDAGNDNTAATQAVAAYETTPPTVAIQNVPASTNSPFTATFEFSEDVSGFVLADIGVGNGTASGFVAVDGNTYTALITPTAEGDVTLDVNAAVATDDAGNDNTAATQAVAAYETTSPTVAIQNVPADTNSPFTATFEFSEDVNGFVLGDISVGNGTASGFTAVDGNTYTALITPTAEGDVTLDVNVAVATDNVGNDNTAATQAVAAYETTPPTVAIQNVPASTNIPFTATFEFSEDVSGFVLADIGVGNGTASSFTAVDGNTYTALITPTTEGNVTLDVNAAVATDAAGNDNTAATQAVAAYETTSPTVAIQNVPASTNSPFTATFEFSEDVSDFVLGDISVGNGTASGFTAVDGNTYTALITPTTEGDVTLDVNAAVATDDVGNDNTAATQAVAAYETTSPTVAIQNVPADTNSPFTATFEFSEDVNGFVLGDISVGNGTASGFTAVDGNTYTALITPTAEGNVTLDVNAAVATDDAGNDNTAATQAVAAYETTSPTVAIQNVPASTNSPFTATFEFSEDVNGFVLGDISVGNGTASGFTAVDGNTYTALITPTAEGDVTLDVNVAVATDNVGNDNTAATQAVAAYETTPPTVAIQNVPASTNSPFTATFEFSEDVSGFVLADIGVGNGTASGFTVVDGNTYTALITPTAEGNVTLDVNAAVATDAAGNDNTAATQAVAAYETTPPTVVIQNVPAETSSAFTATFEFSEDVNDFVLGDISVGNGTASGFTAVDGNTYTALITPTTEGNVTVDVNAAVATDDAGNDNTAASQAVALFDGTAPSVQIQNVPTTTNNPFTATFEFSEDVNGFGLGDISVGNGTASGFAVVDGNTYTVLITPTAEGDVTIDVGAAVAADAAGTDNTAATQAVTNFDNSPPSVQIQGVPSHTNAAFTATFEFSEDVTSFTLDDINVGNGTASNLTAVDGNTYQALITPATEGEVSIDVNAGAASDAAGNGNIAASQAVANFDPALPTAPTVVIVEDTDNNAVISATELSGDIDIRVDLPIDAAVGDTVTISDGNGNSEVITLTAGDLGTSLTTSFPAPEDGDSLTVSALLTDLAGNIGDTGSDSATLDLTSADTPLLTITEDLDDNGLISAGELSEMVDVLVALPVNAGVGDTLTVTDGNGNTETIILSDADLGESISLALPSPGHGNSINATATIADSAGNVSPAGTDAATLDLVAPAAPTVTVSEDADSNGEISDTELSGNIDVTIQLPGDINAGASLLISSGDTSQTVVLSDSDLSAGAVTTSFAPPESGEIFEASASVTDLAGNSGAVGSSMALLNLDTDSDGIANSDELALGTDPNQVDSDGDGIPDLTEVGDVDMPLDTDQDGVIDALDPDDDNDGIATRDEDLGDTDGNPATNASDRDADGIPDYLDTDSDGDGIPDALEHNADTGDIDNDGIIDSLDADDDGIPGTDEDRTDVNGDGAEDNYVPVDSDGDFEPDYLDLDSDNDGAPDQLEAIHIGIDSDNDGIDDAFDADDDGVPGTDADSVDANGDGIEDNLNLADADGDGIADYRDIDSDNDGVPDAMENGASGSDIDNDSIDDAFDADDDGQPGADVGSTDSNGDGIDDNAALSDSDSDGIPDVNDVDSDNDGVPDTIEAGVSGSDIDSDGIDDAFDADDDGVPGTDLEGSDINNDGLFDGVLPDANGDAIPNFQDVDSDGDGLPDRYENNASGVDSDGDAIDDAYDADSDGVPGIDAGRSDSNGDGIDDNAAAPDTDGDGLADYLDVDTDNDGLADGLEAGLSGSDSDGDGIDDSVDADSDGTPGTDAERIDANGDGIIDSFVALDSDSDGVMNFRDLDSDNDSILDVLEAGLPDVDDNGLVDDDTVLTEVPDTDGTDGPDYIDPDSDGDGFNDIFEAGNGDLDQNGDGQVDLSNDVEQDGVPDVVDGNVFGHGDQTDSDGDGIPNVSDPDDDNDGIPDTVENQSLPALSGSDSDGDGIDNALDIDITGGVDTNGDGIDDALDGDSDGDGLPDYLDADADNDGIPDLLESGGNGTEPVDSDSDGIPDYRDQDADNDGIQDSGEETKLPQLSGSDADSDGVDDAIDADLTGGEDLDGNGIDDSMQPSDADNDGLPDYLDGDSDNDSVPDILEGNFDSDGDGLIDSQDSDSDGDGIPDAIEAANVPTLLGQDNDNDGIDDALDVDQTGGSDANNNGVDDALEPADSDGDGLADAIDADSDGDGIPDALEAADTIVLAGVDSDRDGIDDLIDVDQTGGRDVNRDGIDDSIAPIDTDGDGIPNYADVDSDNDGIQDGAEADVSGVDSDNDGIDDRFDVDQTGGVDLNNDGIDDAVNAINSDGDGLPNYIDLDSDNDGVNDVIEAGLLDINDDGISDDDTIVTSPIDTDGDSVPDYRDLDSDNDGVSDLASAGNGSIDNDGDGQIDNLIDIDNDGIADIVDSELDSFGGSLDTDGDGVPNSLDFDDDNDGIPDAIETMNVPEPSGLDVNQNGIDDSFDVVLTGGQDSNGDGIDDVLIGDTDSDGIPDKIDLDSDNDGIADSIEAGNPSLIDADGNGVIDDFVDSDNDGLDDRIDLNLLAVNSDNAGLPDFQDLDSDNDGIYDFVESGLKSGLDSDGDGRLDNLVDVDGNGLLDSVDVAIGGESGTPPGVVDTDGDGIEDFRDTDSDGDGFEDALEGGDFDGDGIADSLENEEGGIETAVNGAGSSDGVFVVLLAMLAFVRKKRFNRHSSSKSSVFVAAVLGATLLSIGLTPEASAESANCGVRKNQELAPCWYLGVGLGISELNPEGEVNGWSTDDTSNRGFDLHFGRHFKPRWHWEFTYLDAGEAGLGNINPALDSAIPDAAISYKVPSIMAGYYLWKKDHGWNLFGRAGFSAITTETSDSRIGEEPQTSVQLAFGLGAQYRFDDSPWFARLQLESYDRDARFLSLRVSRYLGGPKSRSQQARVKPVPAPAAPVVVDSDHDGVPGTHDKCPGSAANAPVDVHGCEVFNGVIKGVNFESNRAVLTPQARNILANTLMTLRKYPAIYVEVQAHTDSQGKQGYNQNLSNRRAQAVVDFLTAGGIKPDRLFPNGCGETTPIDTNETIQGRALNRRVELHIIK